jgi:two-component system sensor histidine kinase QseC
MQDSNLKMQVHTTEEAVWVRADTDKMGTVLINLLVNACKYSPRDSVVEIRIGTHKESSLVQIRNTAQQPVSNIDVLKSEFTKSTELSSGVGMGLWICERVLQLHQSTLHVSQTGQYFDAAFSLPISKS